ncbi:MAG: iron-sulfur cluster assembly scaffold protein [Promethearchaeota archaeon]
MYSQKVIEHFTNPRNILKDEADIEKISGLGKVGNPTCGDLMWIYIDVDENDTIKDIKFKTFGCAAAIATSSMVTEMAKGKTIQEAYKLTRRDVADELDGLPPVKLHCSNLAADGLHRAIEDYLEKHNRSLEDVQEPLKVKSEECCPGCANNEC